MTALEQRQEILLSETRLQIESVKRLADRRERLRIAACFPALVRWRDIRGSKVRQEAVLFDLGSNGLSMRMPKKMMAGQKVFVVFYMADVMQMPSKQISSAMVNPIQAPRVAVRGSVLRAEPLENGLWGVVVVFKQHRFL